MSKLNNLVIILTLLLVLFVAFFGCTEVKNETSFNNDQNFALSVLGVANSDQNFIKVTLLEVTDSRCPSGVECVWAGELGALVNVKQFSDSTYKTVLVDENVNLGLSTRQEAQIFNGNFSISLIEVNEDTNKVSLKVDVASPTLSNEKEWFSISPKQCQSNLWNDWALETGIMIKKSADTSMDEALIPIWLREKHGINVYETKSRIVSDIVCQACTCPTGEQVAVLVDSNASDVLNSLGFSLIPSPVACTMDARICPDGSAVGRTAPFCEFEKCPLTDVVVDSNEPVDENVLITVTKSPGFVINPSTKIITIGKAYVQVEESSRVWDENSEDWNETVTSYSNSLELSEFNSLVALIKSTNFFDLTEDDVVMCVADIPTTDMSITIGDLANSIYGIGSECDKNKTSDVYLILDKVDSLARESN